MNADIISEVVRKLIGEIKPCGDSAIDKERRTNLHTLIHVMDVLLDDVCEITTQRDKKEGSICQMVDMAEDAIMDWHDFIHIEFKQTFPNTAGIFENGGMSGQAFTTQDIDVCIDTDKDVIYVFGNSDLAYIVHSPNYEMVFNDILKRNMCTAKNCIRYWKEKDK